MAPGILRASIVESTPWCKPVQVGSSMAKTRSLLHEFGRRRSCSRFQGPSVLQGFCTNITTWLESVQLPSTCLAWTIQSPSKVVAVPPLDQLCARGRVARTRVSLPPLPVPSFVVCFLLLVPFRTPSSVRPSVLSKSHALFLSSVDMLYLLTILSSSAISAAVDPASGEEALILAASLRSSLSSSLAKYSLCPCVCLHGQHLSLSPALFLLFLCFAKLRSARTSSPFSRSS